MTEEARKLTRLWAACLLSIASLGCDEPRPTIRPLEKNSEIVHHEDGSATLIRRDRWGTVIERKALRKLDDSEFHVEIAPDGKSAHGTLNRR